MEVKEEVWARLWSLITKYRKKALDWAKRNSKKLYEAIRDGYNATVEYCKQYPDVCKKLLRVLITGGF